MKTTKKISPILRFYSMFLDMNDAPEWKETSQAWIESCHAESTKTKYSASFLKYIEFLKVSKGGWPMAWDDLIQDKILLSYQKKIKKEYLFREDNEHIVTETAITHLNAIKSFFEFAKKRGLLSYNPSNTLPKITAKASTGYDVLTGEEIEMMLRQASSEVRTAKNFRQVKIARLRQLILAIFISTGVRQSSLARIRICDYIGGRDPYIWFIIKPGRVSKKKINADCDELIQAWLFDYKKTSSADDYLLTLPGNKKSKLSESFILRNIASIAARGGITKNITPHSIRTSMACMFYLWGYQIEEIQIFLDHKKLETTILYIAKALQELRPLGLEFKLSDFFDGTYKAREALSDRASQRDIKNTGRINERFLGLPGE